MDVPVFMAPTVYSGWWLHRVGAGSGPADALFADVAVQRLIQVLPVPCRHIMHLFSYAFSAHAYARRAPDCVPVFPDQGSILDSHERVRSGLHADDTELDRALSHKQNKYEDLVYVCFFSHWNLIFIPKGWTAFCQRLVHHSRSRPALAHLSHSLWCPGSKLGSL